MELGADGASVTLLGTSGYCKVPMYAGPGDSGDKVGGISVTFTINANTKGTVTVNRDVPVYCQ